MTRRLSAAVAAAVLVGATLYAQGPPPATPSRAQAPEPWRRTGARPCVRPGSGFAQCPDVCPTTLSELAAVAKQLGQDAERMQVLFVTVDPERDTPEVLRQYVPSFDPRFLGLYGDAEATARVAKEFKIFYQKQPQKNAGNYSVDHSAGTYIIDPQGRLRLYARYGAGAPALLHDIRILLASS